MNEETRQSRNIETKTTILRKAHHTAIDWQKNLGQWIEEAIEEKLEREQKNIKQKDLLTQVFLG